jgi:prevent-host-death family protein
MRWLECDKRTCWREIQPTCGRDSQAASLIVGFAKMAIQQGAIMHVTATEAKNRFGYYLGQAEREPVHVMKNDRVAGVIISAARYAELEAVEQQKSLAKRRRDFNDTYKDWIASQNELVERVGVFGEDFRPW